jgi:hypothetical protein
LVRYSGPLSSWSHAWAGGELARSRRDRIAFIWCRHD